MKKRSDNNQRGSALLLTLGILSLVLILAMSFAFTARTNRQVARVNADQVKARLLAESGWQRIRAEMERGFGSATYEVGTKKFTKADTYYYPPVEGRLGFTDTNKLALNNYEQRYAAVPATDDSEESFNKLSAIISQRCALAAALGPNLGGAQFQTILDEDDKVVGRLGFLILEEGGKFDINQLVSPHNISLLVSPQSNIPFVEPYTQTPYLGEQLAKFDQAFDITTDFYYNILGNYSLATYPEANTRRLGLCMQELVVHDDFYANRPLGYSTSLARWFSYDHLEGALGTTFTDKYLAYRFFSGKDIEAYWDVDATTYSDSVERQRFDITGFEWRDDALGSYYDGTFKPNPAASGWEYGDTGGTANSSAYARALVAALINTDDRPEFWDGETPPRPNVVERVDQTTPSFPAVFGIPALRSMTGAYGTLNQQVAANLVDYCDSDSWASVPATVTWSAVPAAEIDYCGNEKVPYFNEVACRIIVDKATTEVTPGNYTYTYRLRLVPSVEMVNIYGEDLTTGTCQVRIQGTWSFTGDGTTVTGNFNIPFEFSSLTVSAMSYAVFQFSEDFTSNPSVLLHQVVDRATDFANPQYSISISNVYMMSGTKDNVNQITDVALWNPSTVVTCTVPVTSSGQQIFYWNLEAQDPRCNHRAGFWTHNDTCSDTTCGMPFDGYHTTFHSFTLSDDNANFDPDHDGTPTDPADKESGVAFAGSAHKTFSTAFIRNGPMETLWELGAIHRGEPYRTINLNKFSAAVGGYSTGDALILDQVKIGPAKFCRGKFNPNSRNPQAIADLLSGIDVTAYNDMTNVGETVSAASISFSGTPSQYRGQFVDSALSGLIGAAADDRTAEAYIGKTAHLLSTREDAYTVIVVAQAMRDLTSDGITWTNGPESASPDPILNTLINPTKYTITNPAGDRYCSILATQLLMAHVVRDAWKNEYEVVQIRYLEE